MQPEAWAHVQRVHLGNNIFLNLHKPTFPGSWSVSREQSTKELPFGTEGFLTTLQNATERVVSAASSTPDAKAHLFIDVGFDQLGRRQLVDLNEALVFLPRATSLLLGGSKDVVDGYELMVWIESQVVSLRMGKVDDASSFDFDAKISPFAMETAKRTRGLPIEMIIATYFLSPEGARYNAYTVIEELGVGRNKLIMSNERILMDPATPKIMPRDLLDNTALIVNCHEPSAAANKYSVRAQRVVCFPVHTLGLGGMGGAKSRQKSNTVLDEFNQAIWEGLQEGHVFVHCLAGVHRAGCVTASHYLWRYFRMRHRHLEIDIPRIYMGLQKRRGGVAPLSYGALVDAYRNFLAKQANNSGSGSRGSRGLAPPVPVPVSHVNKYVVDGAVRGVKRSGAPKPEPKPER